MGSPNFTSDADAPSLDAVEQNTFVCFADMDASPTKAWLVGQRNEARWKWHYDYAFGKRPEEQLFDLRQDPDQTANVAADPKYAKTRAEMAQRLMDELKRLGDPRLVDGGSYFENPPLSGPLPEAAPQAKKRGK
jgi:arylsulfatase A-like enzyme